jgi:phospholipid/cholesterol/gamma-HCH transport system substrate-binding protein
MVQKQVKVGIFVLSGLALLTVAVFMIGDNSHFWDSKVTYTAPFKDVQGLKPGAPVRLGGVDIGTVSSVGYDKQASDDRIFVKLALVKSEAERIRQGSVAHIVNKGLLGDKMVEVTVPDPSAPLLPPGGEMKSEEATDIMTQVNGMTAQVKRTLDNIENATRGFGDPRFSEDIRGSADDLHNILDAVAKGDGAAHRLLMDPREGERLDRTVENLNASMVRLSGLLGEVTAVTQQIRTGPGIAHAVLYDGDLSKNTAGTLDEIHKDLVAIREGNGIAHALVYGDDQTQHVMGNLNVMSDDLRSIVADMRAGKGTLGALLVDPSIYEDLKSAVGNVERNQVLRALVRYSIRADEARPRIETPRVESQK